MPRLDGLAATRRILAQPHSPKIAILTTFHLDEYASSQLWKRSERISPQGHPAGA
jgi:CheY-like chemotaxis protein